jgi:hypothetical protein
MQEYLPYIFTILPSVGGAYLTVRVAMAEMRRDIKYIEEKIDSEIESKKNNDAEIKENIKNIFKLLTNIQVDIAKTQGQGEIVTAIKDAITTLGRK